MDDRSIVALYLRRDETAVRQTAEKYGSRLRALAYYDPAKPECITENRPRKPVFGGAYCFLWAAFLLFFGIMTFTGQVSFS